MASDKASKMTWTTQRPQKPGWYWWRLNTGDEEIVEVYEVAGVLAVDSINGMQGKPLKSLDGHWSSAPIPEPTMESDK